MEELSIKRQEITIKGLFFSYTAIGFYAKIMIENNKQKGIEIKIIMKRKRGIYGSKI